MLQHVRVFADSVEYCVNADTIGDFENIVNDRALRV